uniref:Small ribosomal subunit biogenesis GTPase RsgA n=1 Tax=Rhodopseudomonas palustris (strain BisA53) TaxID=316055 RepID=Q07I14_RHOP5
MDSRVARPGHLTNKDRHRMNTHDELKPLGWSNWFEPKLDRDCADRLARVAAVDRDLLLVMDQTGSFRAKLAGRFLHRTHLPEEMPCVGDWVCLEKRTEDDVAVVHAVLERRTSLRRKSANSDFQYQMIASNVDYAVIVQSCHFDFNLKRLERYLVMVNEGGIEPLILLTKTDLVSPEVLAEQTATIRSAGISAPVITLSNVTGAGIDALLQQLVPAKTYCFVGSSGVGKSTVINRLVGRAKLDTGTVSNTGEGRHTTVRRELILLDGGALVIDNPGMREFGIADAEAGIETSFADLSALATGCRFNDCSHSAEPGCAVREALKTGQISQAHFENYQKLRKEAAFLDLSNFEKRKNDREFGKRIKAAKKTIGRL